MRCFCSRDIRKQQFQATHIMLTLGNILFEWNKFQLNQMLLAADLRLELESPDSQTGIPCITLFYSLNKLIDSVTKREQHPPPKFLYTEEHPEKKSHWSVQPQNGILKQRNHLAPWLECWETHTVRCLFIAIAPITVDSCPQWHLANLEGRVLVWAWIGCLAPPTLSQMSRFH